MKNLFPAKLKRGNTLRVITPARSLALISEESRTYAKKAFDSLGLTLEFSKHTEICDEFLSSPIEERLEDLHDAFSDPKVQGIITVIGGFNASQLLTHIDWNLIKNNPKVFCGYSIITALNTSIYSKTGLVTYYGPHYSTFGQKHHMDYTINYFKECLMSKEPFNILPSKEWTDDAWYKDQENRSPIKNDGYVAINEGSAEGEIVGGNLTTFALLGGTEYFPSLKDKILFIEDDELVNAPIFDCLLQALILRDDFIHVKGLVIGRFQKSSDISNATLAKLIKAKRELTNIPVIAGVDFGHSDPKITFPIGGRASIKAMSESQNCEIRILEH